MFLAYWVRFRQENRRIVSNGLSQFGNENIHRDKIAQVGTMGMAGMAGFLPSPSALGLLRNPEVVATSPSRAIPN